MNSCPDSRFLGRTARGLDSTVICDAGDSNGPLSSTWGAENMLVNLGADAQPCDCR